MGIRIEITLFLFLFYCLFIFNTISSRQKKQTSRNANSEMRRKMESELNLDGINQEVEIVTQVFNNKPKRKKNKKRKRRGNFRTGGFMEIIQFTGPGEGMTPWQVIDLGGGNNTSSNDSHRRGQMHNPFEEMEEILNPFAGAQRMTGKKNLQMRNKVLPAGNAIGGKFILGFHAYLAD